MEYCKRCVYPANAKPTIHFDEHGVCSGCRYHESRKGVDWKEREGWLKDLLDEYKTKAKENNQAYDCIIPVSGGKDSHWQVYLMKEVYGMNPLCVSYNHAYNTSLGLRNLRNLVKQFNVDLVRFSANMESAKKISRYMLKEIGDVTWHYHSGIMTFPIQAAVMYNIPLVIWGEEGFAELTGMFTLDYIVEFTKWKRHEHDMRGWEPDDLVKKSDGYITIKDVQPYVYPSDKDIERVGVRGIYLSNFINWDGLSQTKFLVDKYEFGLLTEKRDGTFSMFHKTDDHCNSIHAYLKYLKFGYGRATDEASEEIRNGRLTREHGAKLVEKYDKQIPFTLDFYLKFWGLNRKVFYDSVDHLRDKDIWEKKERVTHRYNERWSVKDSIINHVNDEGVDEVALPLVKSADRTFGLNNVGYFAPKKRAIDNQYIGKTSEFIIL